MDAKIHYVTVGVVNFESFGENVVKFDIEQGLRDIGIGHVISIETQELKDWEDSNPLNFSDKASAEFKKLFNKE